MLFIALSPYPSNLRLDLFAAMSYHRSSLDVSLLSRLISIVTNTNASICAELDNYYD